MEKIKYTNLDETLYKTTLPNGLQINLLPKPGFHKTYAVLTTDFGALDLAFVPRGQKELVTMPAGIAHFLEHKMFEKADHDAFELFGEYGASANAYTSFTRTSYLFSTTRYLKENLDILLDFVQDPYFSASSVAKEQGIIGQEIQMYADEPNWRVYTALLQAMYPNQALSNDIAGTIESISEITADMLYQNYETFYHPSNMNLFVVGNIEPENVLTWIEENQNAKEFSAPAAIERGAVTLNEPVVAHTDLALTVQRPKVAIGVRGFDAVPAGQAGLKYSLVASMLLDLLLGDTAKRYLDLYNDGIIDDSFSYDFELQRGFHFATISGETNETEAFVTAVHDILNNAKANLQESMSEFELVKKEAIGSTLSMLNSLEATANQYDGELFDGANLLDEVALLESVTFADILAVADEFIGQGQIATVVVNPQTV
ncbi:insulinase family protein [Periweissella cryptocerci]|uniref:Insulinase family protein n=1 Tax=Periweissella cryptocerci TaxID=2506420 RepID=A0A4P6YSJ5_9LACO|nr:pitrilysin family protein [Periweissella cryptocerci]QBO35593.1 insulinase family protein [Periweissella cryptocerci]